MYIMMMMMMMMVVMMMIMMMISYAKFKLKKCNFGRPISN